MALEKRKKFYRKIEKKGKHNGRYRGARARDMGRPPGSRRGQRICGTRRRWVWAWARSGFHAPRGQKARHQGAPVAAAGVACLYRCVAVRTVVVEEGVAIVAPLKTVATGCFDVKREKGIAKGSEYVRTLEWQHLSGTVWYRHT